MTQTATSLPGIADHFKRNLITDTARRLKETHGRLKMYSSEQVFDAVSAAKFPVAWTGWAVAVFCTPPEFTAFCERTGVTADYNNTRLDALRFLDKPVAPVKATLAAAAGAAAIAVTPSSASSGDQKDDRSGSIFDVVEIASDVVDLAGGAADVVGSVASTAVDVVGGLFEALDIFS